jgi:NADPH2:quinone reductase
VNEPLLALGGSIATYAPGNPTPTIPFWPLVFKNVRLFFFGGDDSPAAAKVAAARALNETLANDWPGLQIEARFPLASIAEAHEAVEQGKVSGRVILSLLRRGVAALTSRRRGRRPAPSVCATITSSMPIWRAEPAG